MAVGRNDRCPCGSGRKYKKCCARLERTVFSPAALILALLVLVGLGVAASTLMSPPEEPETTGGRVWSAEHGHWHDAPGGDSARPAGEPIPQPPGPAPSGKVWSPEHGHWHDAR